MHQVPSSAARQHRLDDASEKVHRPLVDCSATIMVVQGRWVVGFVDDNETNLAVSTYGSLDEALRAAKHWLQPLSEEREQAEDDAQQDPSSAARSVTTTATTGEETDPAVLDALVERQRLRSWFLSQVGMADDITPDST